MNISTRETNDYRALLPPRGPRSTRRPPAAVSAHLTRYASRELRATLRNR